MVTVLSIVLLPGIGVDAVGGDDVVGGVVGAAAA